MRFYLGTHETSWLGRTDVPLFVSRRTLVKRVALPRALGYWALDSGGFTELQMFGEWQTSPQQYADEAMRYRDRIGNLEFAAIQDWMCEPIVINGGRVGRTVFVGTKLSVPEHQRRTIRSYLDLKALAPDVPWAPVLQGYAIDDYLDHAEQYRASGVDLERCETVGVGSICRRQATGEIVDLLVALNDLGLRLHAFGMKILGLKRCARLIASSDSLAWSKQARNEPPLDGCAHKNCANCFRYAMAWREKVVSVVDSVRVRPVRRPRQHLLWEAFT